MQINAIIPMNAEEYKTNVLLTPRNSSNPLYWGKEINYTNGQIYLEHHKVDVPSEFDFFNLWCGKDPQGAKQYYE